MSSEPDPPADPEAAPESEAAPEPPRLTSSQSRALEATLLALKTTGRASGRAARWIADRTARAYHAIDPDVRASIADLPFAATTMLGARQRDIVALPDDGLRPLLFVHGLSGHPQNFFPLRGLLYLHGRRRMYSLGYHDDAPLEETADLLTQAATRIIEANQLDAAQPIEIVAHSMGGIVARLALENPEFARRVAQLVTLGTPHHGTLAARFLATPRALDLRPDSAVFKRLERQLPWPGPPSMPKLTAFWSESDIMMLPASTARIDGADNRQLKNITHTGYLTRPSALIRVRDVLL